MNNINNENNVTRKSNDVDVFDRSIKIIIVTCLMLFVGLCAFAVFDAVHVQADPGCPYQDQVYNTDVIYMQKSYNDFRHCWNNYEVIVYQYKYDGVPGVFVSCPELDETMDFYGFSDYKALNINAGENTPKNPSFNLVIKKGPDDESGIYIHPEKYTKSFLIVQHIKYPEPEDTTEE